jgi:hypothetical protein
MPDVEPLRARASRAYEQGRLLAAMRVGLVVVPIAAICAWETGAVGTTFVLALGLLALATAIRWRQRQGFQVVDAGLRSGAVPLAAALALCRFAPSCPPDVALALCGGAGLVAGGFLGRALACDAEAAWLRWSGAALTGGLMAALGCVALGIGSAVGAAVGIAIGSMVSASLPRRATT